MKLSAEEAKLKVGDSNRVNVRINVKEKLSAPKV